MSAHGTTDANLPAFVCGLLLLGLLACASAVAQDFVRQDIFVPTQPGDYPDAQMGTDMIVANSRLYVGLPRGLAEGMSAVQGYVLIYKRTADGWQLSGSIAGDDSARYFGASISNDGDWLSVGAPNTGSRGSVYLFHWESGSWNFAQRIDGPNGGSSLNFGNELAMKGDWLFVGGQEYDAEATPTQGHIYAYQMQGNIWVADGEVAHPYRQSGDGWGSVMEFDGTHLVAGAPANLENLSWGAVFTLVRTQGMWSVQQTLRSSNTFISLFGSTIGLCGQRLTIGAPGYQTLNNPRDGQVFVYERSSADRWENPAVLGPTAPDILSGFGAKVSCDRDLIVASHPAENSIYVFAYADGVWDEKRKLSLVDPFFVSMGGKVAQWGSDAIISTPRFNPPGTFGPGLGVINAFVSDLLYRDNFD